MTDPNHDIVPTLRMFDGVMTGLAADEIERLRKRVAELEADAEAEAREPHSDDVAVDSFAAAMKHKLALARAKGRGGWETCSPADLSRMLREHVAKGDPRDVANFCMMLWHHGSPIVSAPADARVAQADAREGLTDEQILECATRRVPTREVPKIPELAFSRSQFVDVVRALLQGVDQ